MCIAQVVEGATQCLCSLAAVHTNTRESAAAAVLLVRMSPHGTTWDYLRPHGDCMGPHGATRWHGTTWESK